MIKCKLFGHNYEHIKSLTERDENKDKNTVTLKNIAIEKCQRCGEKSKNIKRKEVKQLEQTEESIIEDDQNKQQTKIEQYDLDGLTPIKKEKEKEQSSKNPINKILNKKQNNNNRNSNINLNEDEAIFIKKSKKEDTTTTEIKSEITCSNCSYNKIEYNTSTREGDFCSNCNSYLSVATIDE